MIDKKRVLLIYPQMPDTFYSLKHFCKVAGKKAAYPPYGLLITASLLPKFFEKKLIDLNVTGLKDSDLEWADLVFISASKEQYPSVKEISERCRKTGVMTVAGGGLFVHEHDKFEEIDHFVLNEAELTLPLFLHDLEEGELKKIYSTTEYFDMKDFVLPDEGLIDQKDYYFSSLQFSRGCRHDCDFCDVPEMLGKETRTRSKESVIKELKQIEKSGDPAAVMFSDDNIIENREVLINEVLPAIIEWRKLKSPSFVFITQVTIDLIDDHELMNLMLDAGFRYLIVGIETPERKIPFHRLRNQKSRRDPMRDIFEFHKAGFIVAGCFTLGFDYDDAGVFPNQAKFIKKSGIPFPLVNLLKVSPGTDLYKKMKEEGRLLKDHAYIESESNIQTKMDRLKLLNGFILLCREVYRPGYSFRRMIKFFESYQAPVTAMDIPPHSILKDLIFFLRVLFIVGIFSSMRFTFWRLIFWIIRYDIRFIRKAVVFSAFIYQMDITRQNIEKNIESRI